MEANGRVLVQGREFHARSDHLAYNQQKQQVILTGKDGNNATLWKQTRRGEKPQEVVGRQIIYNRSTGEISVNAASSISGESAVPRK
jgi:lipopolysaccharide export system protein LptA